MSSGVVTIGRRQYASGLYWENSPSGRISQAAKEAARQPGQQASFYAVRPGNKTGRIPQFGLSQSLTEHKASMPVLAACLANQQPGSWAGAFRSREGTAVIVVRDDLIVPDGDQFFMDETEARDRLLQEMALGGLQRIYAPETWGVPGADNMPISLLLNDRTEIKLRTVAISPRNMAIIGGGLGVLLLLLGIGWYIQRRNAEAEAEAQAQMEALERAKNQAQSMLPGFAQAAPKYPPPERRWEEYPHPMDIMKACQDALVKLPATVTGWKLVSLTCDDKALSSTWTREPGFGDYPAGWAATDSVLTASASVAFPTLKPRGHEDILGTEDITRRYLEQNWPGEVNRTTEDPPPPPPADYTGEWSPPPPPWEKRAFTINIPALPSLFPTFFADLPGVIIDSIKFAASESVGGTWTVEGVIYENRR